MHPLKVVVGTLVCSTMLTACNSDSGNSSNTISSNTSLTSGVAKYTNVDCKTMLTSQQLAALPTASTCGYLTVPETHATKDKAESKKTIDVAVVKLASQATNKLEPVAFLSGGPGGSATMYLEYITKSYLLEKRDLYLVDQRGTGLSKPALTCTEFKGFGGTQTEVKTCHDRLMKDGINLSAFTSTQNALDFVKLRELLDIEEWNLYGTSYGTRLATTIMRENSNGIRSVILDGVFPIEVNGISDTPWANFYGLNQIIRNCEASTRCDSVAIKNKIEKVISDLHNNGQQDKALAFVNVLMEEVGDDDILQKIDLVSNDHSYIDVLEAKMIEDDNEMELNTGMGLSVVCAEEYPFLGQTALSAPDDSQWAETTKQTVNKTHHMGFDKPSCKVWNVPSAGTVETQAIVSDLPVLVLNGDNDIQTPPAWGQLVAKNMVNAQVVTNPQGEHVQLFDNNPCLKQITFDFLASPLKKVSQTCINAIPQFQYN